MQTVEDCKFGFKYVEEATAFKKPTEIKGERGREVLEAVQTVQRKGIPLIRL